MPILRLFPLFFCLNWACPQAYISETMNTLTPTVSAWYQDLATGALFEVVAYDEASECIEFQHVDGEVGEYDAMTWNELDLLPAEPPEDWRTPFELSEEDGHYYDSDIVPENFSGALSQIEPELLDLGDDFHLV